MAGGPLISLALILVLGVGASWLAWRLEVPSILLLLVAGFLAGPVLGLLQPDELFGDLLLPLVSFSVGIILFEGGLSLQAIELEEVGSVVRNLVTVGVLATWTVTTGAAYLLLGFGLELSLLLGAILVVTGPTVIIPLLRHLRPHANVSNALKWEGILIDPIGVILSIGVFKAILASGAQAPTALVFTIAKALVLGTVIGLVGAVAVYVLLSRGWTPDVLHVPVTLALVGAAFVSAEVFQAEAGLVAATVMGVALANREDFVKRHIVEFKENLRTLLIGFLFIVLAARLDLSDLAIVDVSSLLFLLVLLFVARPLSVWLSTMGSRLDWRERTFLSVMAPRGIVAAAISSVFALELAERNVPGAQDLVAITFFVIVATVTVYGIAAGPIGRWLGVAEPDPQGLIVVGAHDWARDIAARIEETGHRVLLVDTNLRHVRLARRRGLEAQRGNSLDRSLLDEIDFAGIGHLAAMTSNDEVNSLTVIHFQEILERDHTYQLSPETDDGADVALNLRGRILFDEGVTFDRLQTRYEEGWRCRLETVDEPDEELSSDEERRIPLFLLTDDGDVEAYTADRRPTPEEGDRVLLFAPPEDQ